MKYLIKLIIFLLKPLSFLPAILMMYIIFSFSSQTGNVSSQLSYQVSYEIVTTGAQLTGQELSSDEIYYYIERIHFYVRKAAHMTEYFLLAIAISLPLYVYGLRGFPLLLLAGIICVGFACTDEYHQTMVEGRGPSVRDVCIDSCGAFIGIILVRIVCYIALTPVRISQKRKARRARAAKRRQRMQYRQK